VSGLTVYFDSECAFCQWSRRVLQRFDGGESLRFIDYRECRMAPYSQAEMAGAMHVLDPDGAWFGGYDAFLRIAKGLPQLHWVCPVLALRPVRWIGRIIYRLVATGRYGISKLLFRVAAVPRPCGVTCDAAELSARESVEQVRMVSGQAPSFS